MIATCRIGLCPTSLENFFDFPRSRQDTCNGVFAVRISYSRRLARIEDPIIIIVDVDGPAGKTGFATFAIGSVGIEVFKLDARLGGSGPVAKVIIGISAAADKCLFMITTGWERLCPAGLCDFLDPPGSRIDARDRVSTTCTCDSRRFTCVKRVIIVVVDIDSPAREAGFASFSIGTVSIKVFEFDTRFGGGIPIAEVVAGQSSAAGEGFLMVARSSRIGLRPASLCDLFDSPSSRFDAHDGVSTTRTGDRRRLFGIENTIIVVVDINGPACEAGFTSILDTISVEVFKFHAGLGSRGPVTKIIAGVRHATDKCLFMISTGWEGLGPTRL